MFVQSSSAGCMGVHGLMSPFWGVPKESCQHSQLQQVLTKCTFFCFPIMLYI